VRGEHVEEVAAWLERAMIDEMRSVPNVPNVEDLRVPVEVEVRSAKTWAE